MEMTVGCKFGNWVKWDRDFNYCAWCMVGMIQDLPGITASGIGVQATGQRLQKATDRGMLSPSMAGSLVGRSSLSKLGNLRTSKKTVAGISRFQKDVNKLLVFKPASVQDIRKYAADHDMVLESELTTRAQMDAQLVWITPD